MIAEKQNAHNDEILSVDYNNDGTKIVSACLGGTIKVWGTLQAQLQAPTSLSHQPQPLTEPYSRRVLDYDR